MLRRLRWRVAWLLGGARMRVEGTYSNRHGTRSYRLYRPGWRHLGARPLVVMLHGCRQGPDDFAAGTQMHARGQGRACFVLYPGQDRRANRMGCWNWFEAAHQRPDSGEPAILAEMIRGIVARHRIDPDRVYVAGLSAGGAMAAILATTHPDLFAAVGIHSGLPPAAASSLPSALDLMKRGPWRRRDRPAAASGAPLPTIVFHGDRDGTVHPSNGAALVAHACWRRGAGPTDLVASSAIRGAVPGGRAYTRTLHRDHSGGADVEHWVIHGSGHAWSGGDPSGSFTDPRGPDASREMLRFFSRHRRSRRARSGMLEPPP
jgi:poly(hydroxyalkanoate) depolymerase family esterase